MYSEEGLGIKGVIGILMIFRSAIKGGGVIGIRMKIEVSP